MHKPPWETRGGVTSAQVDETGSALWDLAASGETGSNISLEKKPDRGKPMC